MDVSYFCVFCKKVFCWIDGGVRCRWLLLLFGKVWIVGWDVGDVWFVSVFSYFWLGVFCSEGFFLMDVECEGVVVEFVCGFFFCDSLFDGDGERGLWKEFRFCLVLFYWLFVFIEFYCVYKDVVFVDFYCLFFVDFF